MNFTNKYDSNLLYQIEEKEEEFRQDLNERGSEIELMSIQ